MWGARDLSMATQHRTMQFQGHAVVHCRTLSLYTGFRRAFQAPLKLNWYLRREDAKGRGMRSWGTESSPMYVMATDTTHAHTHLTISLAPPDPRLHPRVQDHCKQSFKSRSHQHTYLGPSFFWRLQCTHRRFSSVPHLLRTCYMLGPQWPQKQITQGQQTHTWNWLITKQSI